MKLTQVLRGFCLIAALFVANTVNAQTSVAQVNYTRDTILRDTFPGLAVMTDSVIRMVNGSKPGEYKYQSVLSTVVVDAMMVKEYRWLVRASDGGLDPFDQVNRFFFLTGGEIDERRIIIFKQNAKK